MEDDGEPTDNGPESERNRQALGDALLPFFMLTSRILDVVNVTLVCFTVCRFEPRPAGRRRQLSQYPLHGEEEGPLSDQEGGYDQRRARRPEVSTLGFTADSIPTFRLKSLYLCF